MCVCSLNHAKKVTLLISNSLILQIDGRRNELLRNISIVEDRIRERGNDKQHQRCGREQDGPYICLLCPRRSHGTVGRLDVFLKGYVSKRPSLYRTEELDLTMFATG